MNKKILTIHSEDRDINKWSNPNEFEVLLPDSYSNINSIKLLNFTGKNNFYNISEKLLNNYILVESNGNSKHFLIPDGYYKPDELALVLTKIFIKYGFSIYVLYDRVKMKFLFISNNYFKLDFAALIHTDNLCSDLNKFIKPESIANQYSNWGFGYNLGFNKSFYDSCNNNIEIDKTTHTTFVNDFDFSLNNKNGFNLPEISASLHYLYSPNTIDLNINNTIYMEIDKYNYADEIMPYQYRSNYLYCNDYNSCINSFFAKIILDDDSSNKNTYFFESRENGNIVFGDLINENKIQKLMKLKFKFRYHNQTLVDFNNQNFNFTLEIEKDSNIKKY